MPFDVVLGVIGISLELLQRGGYEGEPAPRRPVFVPDMDGSDDGGGLISVIVSGRLRETRSGATRKGCLF